MWFQEYNFQPYFSYWYLHFFDNVFSWVPWHLTNDKSTLAQVMAWCRQATSFYLSQYWPRSMSLYAVIRSQQINTLKPRPSGRHLADIFIISWMKTVVSWFILNWSLYLRVKLLTLVQIKVWCQTGDKPLTDIMCQNPGPSSSLTHWGRDKMDAISQTIFSGAFSWMKMFEFRLKFHWSLFLRFHLTIFQHWFR